MSEELPTPELPKVTKEQAIAAFRPFVEQGITNPDDLPLDDPNVVAAHEILDAWGNQLEQAANSSPDPRAVYEANLARSTFYIDAGFTDPDYIDEVANDWLMQDLTGALESGLDELADRIKEKIDELNALIEDK